MWRRGQRSCDLSISITDGGGFKGTTSGECKTVLKRVKNLFEEKEKERAEKAVGTGKQGLMFNEISISISEEGRSSLKTPTSLSGMLKRRDVPFAEGIQLIEYVDTICSSKWMQHQCDNEDEKEKKAELQNKEKQDVQEPNRLVEGAKAGIFAGFWEGTQKKWKCYVRESLYGKEDAPAPTSDA